MTKPIRRWQVSDRMNPENEFTTDMLERELTHRWSYDPEAATVASRLANKAMAGEPYTEEEDYLQIWVQEVPW